MLHLIAVTRRRFLGLTAAIVGVGAGAILTSPLRAEELIKLTESDATAGALGYREDGAKVDAAKFPAHHDGQNCANCKFFLGAANYASAGCQLFPGKSVAAKGWCSAYNAKT